MLSCSLEQKGQTEWLSVETWHQSGSCVLLLYITDCYLLDGGATESPKPLFVWYR